MQERVGQEVQRNEEEPGTPPRPSTTGIVSTESGGASALQEIDKGLSEQLAERHIKPEHFLTEVRAIDAYEVHNLATQYGKLSNAEIVQNTRLTENEVALIRQWLTQRGLMFFNARLFFWQALDYFIGDSLIENFSLDALEYAAETLAAHYASQGKRAIEVSRESYASLKVIRAYRQQRDLSLRSKKLFLATQRIPGAWPGRELSVITEKTNKLPRE